MSLQSKSSGAVSPRPVAISVIELSAIDLFDASGLECGDIVEICVQPLRSTFEEKFYVSITRLRREASTDNGRSMVAALVVQTSSRRIPGMPTPLHCIITRFVSVEKSLHYGTGTFVKDMGTVKTIKLIRPKQSR